LQDQTHQSEENQRDDAWKQIMRGTEKRKYKRLAVKLDLSCRRITRPADKTYTGQTVNVSPGGLYFQTPAKGFKPGNLLKVELEIPATTGLLEIGGRISGFAKVLRSNDARTDADLATGRHGVAAEFCRSPKLCT
jgi:hypothetical protein